MNLLLTEILYLTRTLLNFNQAGNTITQQKCFYYIQYLRKTTSTFNLKIIFVSPETVYRRGISCFMSGSWNIFTYSENLVVTYTIETRDIICYNRYFDDVLKILDCPKITTDEILHFINNIVVKWVQQDATISFFYSQWLYSTCFGWQSHPSSGVQCCIWPQVSWLTAI